MPNTRTIRPAWKKLGVNWDSRHVGHVGHNAATTREGWFIRTGVDPRGPMWIEIRGSSLPLWTWEYTRTGVGAVTLERGRALMIEKILEGLEELRSGGAR